MHKKFAQRYIEVKDQHSTDRKVMDTSHLHSKCTNDEKTDGAS